MMEEYCLLGNLVNEFTTWRVIKLWWPFMCRSSDVKQVVEVSSGLITLAGEAHHVMSHLAAIFLPDKVRCLVHFLNKV